MTTLEDLQHIHHQTPSGIHIYILDKWEVINSEAEAMLQALHSRSVGGLLNHLDLLKKKWADDFMSRFYVGYGHKSIGDCWSMTIFIEGISMLWAKAIQDTKLYNGQEASTRYVDFSKQLIINPIGSEVWNNILEQQRAFYLSLLDPIENHIKSLYPNTDKTNEKLYDKTVKAKAFDIARWFLPAGCSTNLARHTNLRQIADRILILRHHPLEEVREIAETLLTSVCEKYPNSFSTKTYEETEQYLDLTNAAYYLQPQSDISFSITQDNINTKNLAIEKDLINARPNNKTELPTFLDNLGTISFQYKLDFWSFRDIQRHRAPYQRMPLLTEKLWFSERYINSLPIDRQKKAYEHLESIKQQIEVLNLDDTIKQYYLPMGYNLCCEIMGTLPSLVYLIELRSTTYVHPTLRKIAIQMGEYIERTHNIKLYFDKSDDEFDTRRGKHDIEMK